MLVPSGVSAAAAGSHSDTGRPPNTAYYYKVSASNAGGEGLPSTAVLAGGCYRFLWYRRHHVQLCIGRYVGDGRYKSPAISGSGVTKARISFTGASSTFIMIQLDVSSESGYDYAFISQLDNASAAYQSGYYSGSRISGENSVTVTIPVTGSGSHFIDIGYRKDSSASSGSDCAWFKGIQ